MVHGMAISSEKGVHGDTFNSTSIFTRTAPSMDMGKTKLYVLGKVCGLEMRERETVNDLRGESRNVEVFEMFQELGQLSPNQALQRFLLSPLLPHNIYIYIYQFPPSSGCNREEKQVRDKWRASE